MDTRQTAFSGKPETGISQSSHSSSKPPLPAGPLASATETGQTRESRQPNEAGGAACSAPSPGAGFDHHLAHLRKASEQAGRVMESICPGHRSARESMSLAWDYLFDMLKHDQANPNRDLPDINTLASIIQKLMSASSQIKTLELKVRDQQVKEEDREAHKREVVQSLNELKTQLTQPERGLTKATLREIERKLNLL